MSIQFNGTRYSIINYMVDTTSSIVKILLYILYILPPKIPG